jgi:hypothetical protein
MEPKNSQLSSVPSAMVWPIASLLSTVSLQAQKKLARSRPQVDRSVRDLPFEEDRGIENPHSMSCPHYSRTAIESQQTDTGTARSLQSPASGLRKDPRSRFRASAVLKGGLCLQRRSRNRSNTLCCEVTDGSTKLAEVLAGAGDTTARHPPGSSFGWPDPWGCGKTQGSFGFSFGGFETVTFLAHLRPG